MFSCLYQGVVLLTFSRPLSSGFSSENSAPGVVSQGPLTFSAQVVRRFWRTLPFPVSLEESSPLLAPSPCRCVCGISDYCRLSPEPPAPTPSVVTGPALLGPLPAPASREFRTWSPTKVFVVPGTVLKPVFVFHDLRGLFSTLLSRRGRSQTRHVTGRRRRDGVGSDPKALSGRPFLRRLLGDGTSDVRKELVCLRAPPLRVSDRPERDPSY